MSQSLDNAITALHNKVTSETQTATPEQLAYLGKALEAVSGQTATIGMINDEGAAQIQAVQGEGNTQIAAVKKEGSAQVNAVKAQATAFDGALPKDAAGKLIPVADFVAGELNNVQTQVPQGSLPFIFGVISRYGDGAGGYGVFTSELGQFYNGQALNQLRLISGYHGWGASYRAFNVPPSIQFMSGSNGQFIYRNFSSRYANWGNEYNYPRALMGVIFVKNTTDKAITRNIWFGGSSSSNTGYGYMGVNVLIPNNTNANAAKITSLSQSNRWNYTGNTWGNGANVSIVVPANTTVAVMLYASEFFPTSWGNSYYFFGNFALQNMRNFFGNGLEVDLERTIKAHANPGGSANPVDIWK